jgi:hypothetical protein
MVVVASSDTAWSRRGQAHDVARWSAGVRCARESGRPAEPGPATRDGRWCDGSG